MRLLSALLIALVPAGALADPPEGHSGSAPDRGVAAVGRTDAQLDEEHPPLGVGAVAADAGKANRAARTTRAKARGTTVASAAAEPEPPEERGLPPGRYGGVVPGGANSPPHLPRNPGRTAPQMAWLGFRVDKGVPTVFVELTRPVVWSLDEKPDALIYTLQQTSIPLANNRRPLDVTAFGTSIKSVVAARHGHDVQLTIRTAGRPPKHREHHEPAPGGLKFLVVELPGS